MTPTPSAKELTRPIGLILRDLRGLLTPLTRPFDFIDQHTLNQLFSELEALDRAGTTDDRGLKDAKA